jgi:hypothetical protein
MPGPGHQKKPLAGGNISLSLSNLYDNGMIRPAKGFLEF